MNTAEGSGKISRIAKLMRKDKRDVVGTNFIKSDTGEIKVQGDEVCERWKECFKALLNGENESELEVVKAVEGPLHEITEEVERALKGMKSGRAAGPSGLTSDMLKYAGRMGMVELLRVFQKIMRSGTMPMEWGHSLTIPLYRGKEYVLQCGEIQRFEAVGAWH